MITVPPSMVTVPPSMITEILTGSSPSLFP